MLTLLYNYFTVVKFLSIHFLERIAEIFDFVPRQIDITEINPNLS